MDKVDDGVICMVTFLNIVVTVILDVVQDTNSAYAFRENGFSCHFGFLSSYIMKQ